MRPTPRDRSAAVSQDNAEAVKWFRKAADQGVAARNDHGPGSAQLAVSDTQVGRSGFDQQVLPGGHAEIREFVQIVRAELVSVCLTYPSSGR